MNAKLLCLPLLLSCLSVQAQIYKTVDADGNVVFTDSPGVNQQAETVDIKVPNTIDATPVTPYQPAPAAEEEAGYQSLSISPAHDSTVRSNTGDFAVSISVNPPLQPGHSVQLYLDGQRQNGSGTRYQFTNIDRGSHQLRATVVDGNGKVLIEQTNPVHVQRTTAPRPAPLGHNDEDDVSILPDFGDLISLLPFVEEEPAVTPGAALQPRWPRDRLVSYEDAQGNLQTRIMQPQTPVWPKDRLQQAR